LSLFKVAIQFSAIVSISVHAQEFGIFADTSSNKFLHVVFSTIQEALLTTHATSCLSIGLSKSYKDGLLEWSFIIH